MFCVFNNLRINQIWNYFCSFRCQCNLELSLLWGVTMSDNGRISHSTPSPPQKNVFNQNFSSLSSQWSNLVISLTTVDFCPIYPGGEIMSNAAMKRWMLKGTPILFLGSTQSRYYNVIVGLITQIVIDIAIWYQIDATH